MNDQLLLDLAHAALASVMACECKAHIPGDETEDHEDNTFGLPDGAPIRRKMRAFYRAQIKQLIGFVGKIGAEVPATFPRMADYDDPMASAMTPILGVYWDRAGKGVRGRLGLDPDEWRVTDPNVHKAIAKQALTFCRSTNAATDLAIGAAAEAVRDKLRQGLIGDGQTVPELTAAVQGVFTRLSKSKAETIARTESSRAIHTATEMSAEASGVVVAKRWLLSANSCPICVAIAQRANRVPLGGSFGTVGHSAAFSDIKNPPAHPNCRCSTTFELAGDVVPPVPAFVPKPKGDGDKPKKPSKPRKPAAAKPPEAPRPARPILPGRPIAERLAAYTAGDAKVKAIAEACDRIDAEAKAERDTTRERRHELLRAIPGVQASGDTARVAAMEDELHRLIARFQDLGARKRAAVLDLIRPPEPATIAFDRKPVGRMAALRGGNLAVAEQARHFLGSVLARGEDELKVRIAQIPKNREQRAYYKGGDVNQVHLKVDEKASVAVHELGHFVDARLVTGGRRAGEVAREFLAHRVGDEKPARMKDLFPGYRYKREEMGRKDRFDRAFDLHSAYYVGKDYGGTHASEITSMGLELLHEDPGHFARADPEYCKFILGLLDGSLR